MKIILALTKRILQQLLHDPRTLALLIVAPIVALWLFSEILGSPSYQPKIAAIDLPEELQLIMEKQEAKVVFFQKDAIFEVEEKLQNKEIDAIVKLQNDTLLVKVEGADASKTGATMSIIQSTLRQFMSKQKEKVDKMMEENANNIAMAKMFGMETPKLPLNISEIKIDFFYGSEKWTGFDFFGPVFIGIFIFVFVFITSGMSLVNERIGGTMERLLVTPIKSWQLVAGYSVGFGAVSLVQACVVLWASISLIGFPCEGNFMLVILVTFSMALVSLTLGLLVSALAKTAFQVFQLMVLLIVPQVLLSGIFDLSQSANWLKILSNCFPISYGAEALRDIMLRNADISVIAKNLIILWIFIIVFFSSATIRFNIRRKN